MNTESELGLRVRLSARWHSELAKPDSSVVCSKSLNI
jgi:hypothetical protein